ncbi:MAG: ribonuclease HI family protein [Massilia sp.]
MNELHRLLAAASKTERTASRRLADSAGLSEEQALRQTLAATAGAAGLAALLRQRQAQRVADERRAAASNARKEAARALRQARHDGPATQWRAWFDGSARPNPGRCSIGALLKGPAGELVQISQSAGHGNSSEAEYRALIALLEAALQHGAHELTVYGDSQVVIDDVNGPAHAAAPALQPYRQAALALLAQLPHASLRWVPRHKNQEADALSQRGSTDPLEESLDDILPD